LLMGLSRALRYKVSTGRDVVILLAL